MKIRLLLLCGSLLLSSISAMATIVDGVRQKPTYQTMEFSEYTPGDEVYLYNVEAGLFYTNGNAYLTQASVGKTPLLVRFETAGSGDYFLRDYFRNSWMYSFFQNESTMYVDRADQPNHYWGVEENGDGTFKLMGGTQNPDINPDIYPGFYMGLDVTSNASNTALTSCLLEATDHYITWTLVSKESYESLAEDIAIYNKAQELKELIDKIEAENGDANSVRSVYLNEDATIAELEQAIENAQPLYVAALINNATDKNNVDVTAILKNPEYENGTNGWTVEAVSGGNVAVNGTATNKCFEAWNNGGFDIYQEVSALPVGVYEIEVQGFYRYLRGDNAWNAYKAGGVEYVKKGGVPVYVYMNNNSTPFVNVFDEPVPYGTLYTTSTSLMVNDLPPYQDDQGNWYPNEMYNSALAFSAGMYKQSAFGLVAQEGDKLRLGVKGVSNQGNDSWVIWDNFKLVYRGFQPDVIKPVLEKEMASVQENYMDLLMGKTEYAALTQALADAATSIENNDGKGMFNALNALYDAKDPALASKDIFLEKEVPAALTSLTEAIGAVGEQKLSTAVLGNAQTLKANIEGNAVYENDGIDQLKEDVVDAIADINNSITLYNQLFECIANLETAATQKVAQAWVDAAAELKAASVEGYNAGSFTNEQASTQINQILTLINNLNASATRYTRLKEAITNLQAALDENAPSWTTVRTNAESTLEDVTEAYNAGSIDGDDVENAISELTNQLTELNASAALYAQFYQAIGRLQDAIAEVEGEEQHVSANTLAIANAQLNNANTVYADGTIADENIERRINNIDGIIENLTKSVRLYNNFNDAIAELKETVDKNEPAAATVRDNATAVLATAEEAYERGSIADEDIETQIALLNTANTTLVSSVEAYRLLPEPIAELQAAVDGNANAAASTTTRNNATTILSNAKAGYADGTIADNEIETLIEQMADAKTALANSVSLYAELPTPLDNLATALEQKAAQTVIDGATDVFDEVTAGYNNGTIEDGDVAGAIENVNTQIAALNASAALYALFYEAIGRLQDAIAEVEGEEQHVSANTLAIANAQLNNANTVYADGTIADENIERRINNIDGIIENLTKSVRLYKDFNTALDYLNTALTTTAQTPMSADTRTAAQGVYAIALEAYNAGTVDDDQIAEQKTALEAQITAINNSVTLYEGLNTAITNLGTALQQKAAQSVIGTATTVFNDASAAYTDGNIADADVASTITSINAQTSALNTSAGQYAQLNTALGNFQTAITAAQEAGASVTMITNANSLKAGYQSGYDNGSEENVPAALTAISNAIANLGAAAPLYPQANNLNTKLADLATELGKADNAIAEAEDALEQYLSSELRSGLETALDDLKAKVNVAKTNKSTMADNLAGYQLDLTNSESTLGEDHADLYADMGTAFNTMSGNIDNLFNSLNQLRTNLEGVTENAVEESANKVEIAHNIATFCSMMDLDFTGEEKVRAYIVSAFTPSTGDAILTRVYDVPKGTGVVLIGDNGSYEIPAGTGATVVSNLLVGVNRATVLHQVDGDYTNFILTNGESGEGFYPVEDGSTLAAGKAYLPLPTASLPASGIGNGAAIRFVFEDSGEATFIDSVGFDYAGSKMEKGVYYNLNGQRVGRPVTGGIYILDGKKVYVK